MFNNNKKQYINIIQQNKQIKINYKTIHDDKILKEENSAFLVTNEKLPEDAKFKLNSLQKNIPHTFISSLIESSNQNIVSTDKVDVISYDAVKIGNNQSIIIPKNEINSINRYFQETGIDFILSPYTIVEEYLDDNGKKNSLNFLIYNNIIYALIYNDKKEIAYSKIKTLTPFESTQDETFSEDDIVGQKLYEEVNFLEIQQFLIDAVEDYYTTNTDTEFLENIEILYSLKPLSQDQIESLKETMMIPIEYRAISINDYIDEIIQNESSQPRSFVKNRVKKEDKSIYLWIALAVISIGLVIGVLNYKFNDNKTQSKQENLKENSLEKNQKQEVISKKKKQTEIQSVTPSTIMLPSHVDTNNKMIENIKMLFDVIPYDAILKDIEISEDKSTFVSNFISNSNSIADMQIKLNNIYNDSKILLKHKNKIVVNTIIQNMELKKEYNFNQISKNVNYKIYNFLPTAKATKYLVGLCIPNSVIKYDFKERTKFTTYRFNITSKIKSPDEFFSFIKKINSQQLSIELAYPITFSKTNQFLEVKYTLNLHQKNKKQAQLIK